MDFILYKCDLNVDFRKKKSEYFIGVYVHEKYVSVCLSTFRFQFMLLFLLCESKYIFKPPDICS